jgi:hypothetical protein
MQLQQGRLAEPLRFAHTPVVRRDIGLLAQRAACKQECPIPLDIALFGIYKDCQNNFESIAADSEVLSDFLSRLIQFKQVTKVDAVLGQFSQEEYKTPFTLTVTGIVGSNFVEEVSMIMKKFRGLTSLTVLDTAITDSTLHALLGKMPPELPSLQIVRCPQLTSDGMRALRYPTALKSLTFERVAFTNKSSEGIFWSCKNLISITFKNCAVTEAVRSIFPKVKVFISNDLQDDSKIENQDWSDEIFKMY